MLLTNAFNLNVDFGSQGYVCERCGFTIKLSDDLQETGTEFKCKKCGTDIPHEIVRSVIAAAAGAVTCYMVMGYWLVDAMDSS
jgi:predicted RNA-binding Zn-ribbon protein involved in translation (DUF1610 family)